REPSLEYSRPPRCRRIAPEDRSGLLSNTTNGLDDQHPPQLESRMSPFMFRPAQRADVNLILGLAGGTGSGKTLSALKLAKGLAGGKPFAFIDAENGRGLMYADDFEFFHGNLTPPFRPDTYAEAIKAADDAGYPVIVVDSASHEYAGEGGV